MDNFYLSHHRIQKRRARSAWSLSICSAASLALFCAAFVLDVYNGFIYLPSDAVFLYALMLLMETLGLFAPVIYALYESLSRLRAQYKKPSAPPPSIITLLKIKAPAFIYRGRRSMFHSRAPAALQ